MKPTTGIHHITAIVGDAQRNVDFYAGVLGLRLVKRTVNFDDPETYHLYFGNEKGSPGTAMTVFPYPTGRKGRVGGGQVSHIMFATPPGSLGFWMERLASFHIDFTTTQRFGETYIEFADRDGLQLEIVERSDGAPSEWAFAGIPTEKALKGFAGAVLLSYAPEKTMEVLSDVLGLERAGEDAGLVRFTASADLGNTIDVKMEAVPRGHGGQGTVHHIAWRATDIAEQEEWRERLVEVGLGATPIRDRKYFTSIYFREPGEILFEIATDGPGFDQDEPVESLGENLMLPPWMETIKERVVQGLPPLEVRVPKEV